MNRIRLSSVFGAFGLVAVGVVVGGYLFADTQPRSFLAVHRCEGSRCLRPQELLGLLGSVLMQRAPDLLPGIVIETDRTVAIRVPAPSPHFVIIPKRDIRNVGDLTAEDAPWLIDAYAVIGRLVREQGLEAYQVMTRGPGDQSVAYLHFHLVAEREGSGRVP